MRSQGPLAAAERDEPTVAPRRGYEAVGWALTGVTCLVLTIGVTIIRQLGVGSPRVSSERTPGPTTQQHAATAAVRDPIAPLVLRPVAPSGSPSARVAELPTDAPR
ncbi:MAG: hypothetical protein ACRCT8_01115 [Lacipirellulaceae bacterium]